MIKLSICVIAYNEEKFLPGLLQNIKAQNYPHQLIEVVLVDGMSVDGTKELMNKFSEDCKDFYSIQVLDNPKKIQAAGWNVAITHATGDVISRIDAHAVLPEDFSALVVRDILEGENIVGGIRQCIIEKDSDYGKMLLATDQYGSILASNNGYYFRPIDLEAAVCAPPSGLQPEEYCLHYRQSFFGEDMYRLVELVKDGDAFYVKGLCGTYAPDGWCVGRRDGDYVRFASGQYQGVAKEAFLDYMYGGRVDPLGSLDGHEPERSLQFSYSSATGELASSGVVLETIGDRILVDSYAEPELKPYLPKEAVPAKPEMRGYTEYPDFTVVRFNIPPVDENGDYIDPKGIVWRLMLDGEPYVFDPEVFGHLSERKEVFAWGECDGEKGVDIVFESCGLYNIWLYENFNTVAVECTFTHDGKSHTVISDAMEVGHAGIDSPDASCPDGDGEAYTLDGIPADGSAPGIVVEARKRLKVLNKKP